MINDSKRYSIKTPLLPEYNELLDREKKVPRPLKRQQINQCIMELEDSSPLVREAGYVDVWPCLKICKCTKKKPNFRLILKICLHREMDIRISKSEYART